MIKKAVIFDADGTLWDLSLIHIFLYEAHRDSLVSVALFSAQGKYIAAVPISAEKKNRKVTEQDWYREAVQQVENLHFSLPHVQNLFDDPSYRTHWVISLSRVVELNFDGRSDSGVLLVEDVYKRQSLHRSFASIKLRLLRIKIYIAENYFIF